MATVTTYGAPKQVDAITSAATVIAQASLLSILLLMAPPSRSLLISLIAHCPRVAVVSSRPQACQLFGLGLVVGHHDWVFAIAPVSSA
jgi:hypothetical protein